MQGYTETVLPKPDVFLFRQIEHAIQRMTSDPISCHVLARAVTRVWKTEITLVDGYFRSAGLRYNHSWVITANQHIIDIYPIAAVGGPLLLDGSSGPWPSLYAKARPGWWDDECEESDIRRVALDVKRATGG